MAKDRQHQKLEKLQQMISAKLKKSDEESVYISFEEFEKEPLLKDRVGLIKILDIIKDKTHGHVSWKTRTKLISGGGLGIFATEVMAFQQRIPPPPNEIGVDINVAEPLKLEKYFDAALLGLKNKVTTNQNTLIQKREDGNYYYNNFKIDISMGTIYYDVFDILFLYCDPGGFLSYEDIEEHLRERDHSELEDDRERNDRIQNAITNENQGLFRSAKVNQKKFENITLKKEKLIVTVRGKGLRLNNPIL